MLNLLISLGIGAAVAMVIKFAGFGVAAAAIPAVIAAVGSYVLLARRTFGQFQKVVTLVQAELQTMTPNRKDQLAKSAKAVKMLEGALPLGRWQFLIASEVHGQVGMIKHLFKDYAGAMQSFEKSSSRNYLAKAMQAAISFQKKDVSGMEKAFEAAVSAGKKESLMWAAYAWCELKLGNAEKAIAILTRGATANPSDEKLKKALAAVQNDKRIKMNPWEPMWWQLGLEQPPTAQPQFVGGGRRRMARGR